MSKRVVRPLRIQPDDGMTPDTYEERCRVPKNLLVYRGQVFINFQNGTHQFVDIKLFDLPEPSPDDRTVLDALLAHDRYRDTYAGGSDVDDADPEHGPYRLRYITFDSFVPVDAITAEAALRSWAEEHPPTTTTVRDSLERDLYPRIRTAANRYRLRDLGKDAFHDWGWVLGEFHELVVIDSATATLALVVASDD